MQDRAAVVLVGDMNRNGKGPQCVQGGLAGNPGRIVGFAQVSQNDLAQIRMYDSGQQFSGGIIGQVAFAAADALFQMPGIRSVHKHRHIMIGFYQQQVAALETFRHQPGGNTQIGGHADAQAVAGKGESNGVGGIVGEGKRVDVETGKLETHAGLKVMPGGQMAQSVLDGAMRGRRQMDRQIEPPGQNADPANMIRMLVGDEDRI